MSQTKAVIAAQSFEGLISVSKIRSQNPKGFGGCIFSGYEVDDQGKKCKTNKLFEIHANYRQLPGEVSRGERWRVSGIVTHVEPRNYNGFIITQYTVESNGPLLKERETGELIINLVAKNPNFKRVGDVRMRKLWNRFGNDLYDILDNGDMETLAKELGVEDAAVFIESWADHVSGSIVSFLSAHKIPIWLSRKVIEFHGANVEAVLKEDPYRLLSFTASWSAVDSLARQRFGIADDDPRRLRAAIEESLYRLVDTKDHTCVPSAFLKPQLKRLLQINNNRQDTNRLIDNALADNASNGAYIITEDGHYWPTGAYIMEEYVAEQIAAMVADPDPIPPSLFLASMNESEINRLIHEFEDKEHERIGKPFNLNPAQREAVHNCVNSRFSVITGGAGTGKTTVLRCLYYVLHRASYSICQMALSGRAATRMHVATGVDATTIAGYLHNSDKIIEKLGDFGYYIIDEASMLDISNTYQILRSMPEDKSMRMVMVGDPYQLPPIMAGLVFHVLAESDNIPIVNLTEVKRQEEESGIPAVANAIRHGTLPVLHSQGTGVRFIPCPDSEIIGKVLELFSENPDATQILCATRTSARSGTIAINTLCHAQFTNGERELLVGSDADGYQETYGYSGFREGDRVMFTKNDYARKVSNGSIGSIIEVYDEQVEVPGYEEPAIAKGRFEGINVQIFESDIKRRPKPKIEFGYAATVHKSQGSQWPRVIIPISWSKNLDRTLIYTAITRAECEVILIGDENALREAVRKAPKAHMRSVGFRRILPVKISQMRAACAGGLDGAC